MTFLNGATAPKDMPIGPQEDTDILTPPLNSAKDAPHSKVVFPLFVFSAAFLTPTMLNPLIE